MHETSELVHKSAPSVAGAAASTRFAAAGEGAVLAWAAAALEDAQGDFGDARHATLDFLGE
jgi:hypothetical protein